MSEHLEKMREAGERALAAKDAEILALRARVAKLEAALKPFVDAHFYYNDAGKPDDLTTGIGGVTYGDFRQAVSILAEGEIARAALKDAPQ